VQTSGRDTPDPVRLSLGANEALVILTHWYAQGGDRRIKALALWLTYGYATPATALDLALALTIDERKRLEHAREWQRWGTGAAAQSLTATGVQLIGEAINLYQWVPVDLAAGATGRFGEFLRSADAARGSLKRMHSEHTRELLRAKIAKASQDPANQATRAQRRVAMVRGEAARADVPVLRWMPRSGESQGTIDGTGWTLWAYGGGWTIAHPTRCIEARDVTLAGIVANQRAAENALRSLGVVFRVEGE
jgi:hypothetical protein